MTTSNEKTTITFEINKDLKEALESEAQFLHLTLGELCVCRLAQTPPPEFPKTCDDHSFPTPSSE